jgi:hypothetical protein
MPRLIGRTPVTSAPTTRAPRSKPDPWPMRFALGLGGMAAVSALATAIVMPPPPPEPDIAAVDATDAPTATANETAGPTPTVRYIQLKPGETAPPGATVIPAPTSPNGTVVVSLATAAPKKVTTVTRTAAPKPVVTPKTKQSATPKP